MPRQAHHPEPGLTLDDVVPAPDVFERHQRHVAAPPGAVWNALLAVRLEDSPLSRALMGVRTLPDRLTRKARPATVSGRFLEHGPIPVLGMDVERRIVAGGLLQPWKLRGGAPPPHLTADELRAFAEPGWAKCGMDFVLEPDGAGTLLRTETRVRATDPATRRRFGLYWLLIRAGSGLIRRELLRATERAAVSATERAAVRAG